MRNYKRKRPRQWRNKDKRMDAAVRLRAGGMSLRQIGKVLAVDAATVMRDLRRWDELQAAAPGNVLQLPVATCPPGGEMQHPDATPEPPISMIDRRRA